MTDRYLIGVEHEHFKTVGRRVLDFLREHHAQRVGLELPTNYEVLRTAGLEVQFFTQLDDRLTADGIGTIPLVSAEAWRQLQVAFFARYGVVHGKEHVEQFLRNYEDQQFFRSGRYTAPELDCRRAAQRMIPMLKEALRLLEQCPDLAPGQTRWAELMRPTDDSMVRNISAHLPDANVVGNGHACQIMPRLPGYRLIEMLD